MKLFKRLQLLWLRLTECDYQVVKVTPKNVYRIRKYYKHLPNFGRKYFGYGGDTEEFTNLGLTQKMVVLQRKRYCQKINKLLDKINENEIPV